MVIKRQADSSEYNNHDCYYYTKEIGYYSSVTWPRKLPWIRCLKWKKDEKNKKQNNYNDIHKFFQVWTTTRPGFRLAMKSNKNQHLKDLHIDELQLLCINRKSTTVTNAITINWDVKSFRLATTLQRDR